MKKIFSTFLCLFSIMCLQAQNIRFEKSYESAKVKALSNNKTFFVLIPGPTQVPSVIPWGLRDREVVSFFNTHFVNYKISSPDSILSRLRKEYTIDIFPAYLFFDKDGNLLYRADKRLGNPEVYLRLGREVLKTDSSKKNHRYYIENHRKGLLTQQELKEYIQLRQKLGVTDNDQLADEYVNTLAVKDLDDYQTVLFILSTGPTLASKAFPLANTNRKIVDSIYKTEPLEKRNRLNNAIIINTANLAVKTKNQALAERLATFTSNTWGKDYKEGAKAYQFRLLSYYRAVKDTSNFLRRATAYYDSYYYLTADSIRKLDVKAKTASLQKNTSIRIESLNDTIAYPSSLMNSSEQFVSSGATSVANILNNGAWEVYKTGTKNQRYLDKAILWSRKTLTLEPIAPFHDTLAHLLYRKGLYAEAQAEEEKAIDLAGKAPFLSMREKLKSELKKMKARNL